uniref:Uncharacterized protein n=1 Tax=Ciona savignyi TaxID=51511 RepID=H2Z441_CIOSA
MDYAGSDKLWAGIITHISRSIDEAFGKWAVKIFRTWHYTPDLHLKPYLNTPKPGQKQAESGWKIAKWSSYIVPVLGLLLMALVVYCFVSFGIPDLTPISEAASEDIATTAVTAAVGIGISIKIIDAIKMVINLVVSQAARITSMSKKADFSTSLGFMAKVKTEIYYMTSVVQYMSILLQYDVKICLIIDDVDLLGKEKIMGLFKVVSLLQNSRNSRYIQIHLHGSYDSC